MVTLQCPRECPCCLANLPLREPDIRPRFPLTNFKTRFAALYQKGLPAIRIALEHAQCSKCKSRVYPTFYEDGGFRESSTVQRVYFKSVQDTEGYLISTYDTVFTLDFLRSAEDQLYIHHATFSNITQYMNKEARSQVPGTPGLNPIRLRAAMVKINGVEGRLAQVRPLASLIQASLP